MIRLEYLIILTLATIFLKFFVKNRSKIGSFFKVLDIPKKDKIHKKITPLIGSFPIVILSLIIFIYFSFTNKSQDIFYILIYSYIFFLMGYLDDKYGLNAYLKLLISIIIIFVALNSFEFFIIEKIYVETFNKFIFLNNFKIFFSILCIVLLINALNLMDGINGLASGFASFWMLSLSFVYSDEKIFGFFFMLSVFGFINTFHIIKGKYFLGDSGTLFFGCLIGLSTIYIYNKQLISGELVNVEKIFIFFMIPGIDMFRLFLVRLSKKMDPFGRDLNHLHHIMLKKFSLNKTLLTYLVLFLSSNLFSHFNIIDDWLIIIIYLTIYVFFIFSYKNKFKKTS